MVKAWNWKRQKIEIESMKRFLILYYLCDISLRLYRYLRKISFVIKDLNFRIVILINKTKRYGFILLYSILFDVDIFLFVLTTICFVATDFNYY